MKRHCLYIAAIIALIALFSILTPAAQIVNTQLHIATVNGGNAEYIAMRSTSEFPWGILKFVAYGIVTFFYIRPYFTEQK